MSSISCTYSLSQEAESGSCQLLFNGCCGPWDGVSDGVVGGGVVSAGEEICYLEAGQAMITSCQC